MKANYHTHTARCGHASGTEREYIEAAIRNGYRILGFADHAAYPFDPPYYSGFRMRTEQLSDYVETVRSLAKEYRNDIRILLGFEAEYYPGYFGRFLDMIAPYDFDYLILGQHFLGNEQNDYGCCCATDDETVLRRFVDQTLTGLATGCYTYMAHPDIFHFTGKAEAYREQMSRLCRFGHDNNIPMELNLLGFKEHRHYPREDFLALCAEFDTPMILGVDAHSPDRFDETELREQAVAWAKANRVRLIDEAILRAPNRAVPLI